MARPFHLCLCVRHASWLGLAAVVLEACVVNRLVAAAAVGESLRHSLDGGTLDLWDCLPDSLIINNAH